MSDEDEMAAAMAEMAEQGADGGGDDMAAAMASMGGDDAGSLSQDEIDSLLGFGGDDSGSMTGVQALLDRSLRSYERLPMLEVVFDRFVRTLSTSMRNFTSENVDINVDSITSLRFEDYMHSIPLPPLICVFQSLEWENYGLITFDSALTYSIVDVLLGGGRSNKPVRVEGRPFTTIEQDIIKTNAEIILDDLGEAFSPLTPATFRFDRLETNPQFASITRPANAVIMLSLRVEMDDRGGRVELILPYVTIDPIKDLLLQMFTADSFGTDASWEDYLSLEVLNTEIDVEAVLGRKKLTLKELGELQVGKTLLMETHPDDDIALTCKGINMFRGKMGSAGKNIAVQISHVLSKDVKQLM